MTPAKWEPPAGFDAALKREFGYSARALPTPALTGVRLWKLTRDPADYPVLPEEIRRTFYTGQARLEFCAVPGLGMLDAIYEYDYRWAYVACATGQVCGHLTIDDVPAIEPHARGFYEIEFEPPRNWAHVGLFMVRRPHVAEGWWYPTSGTHQTIAGWTEVVLAKEFNWNIKITRRWLWDCRRPAPLDMWRDKLLRIAKRHPEMAGAVRDVIIRTIGQFHSRGREVYRTVATAAEVPEERVLTARRLADGQWQYRTREALPEHLRAVMHPEWSADIYARCRTRLLRYQVKQRGVVVRETGALTVPRADVLAIRTDGIWLARDPGWEQTGEIGEMRLRGTVPGPVPAPASVLEIRDLRARMVRQ